MPISKLDKELLLSYFLKKPRAYVIAHPQEIQDPEFLTLIQRREAGEPIAYITGEKEFWSLNFTVNSHVLIPRPETELLIEMVLEKFDPKHSWKFLELGTGSGAIAITLAKSYPHSRITATDISSDALLTAKINQQKHDVNNIAFIQSDWFSHVSDQFDLIISNPPYIAENDLYLLEADLLFEPKLALTSGREGLAALTEIIKLSSQYLLPNGWLMVEHGYDQGEKIYRLFEENQFSLIENKVDLNSLPRVTFGKRSGINS